jgi:transposase
VIARLDTETGEISTRRLEDENGEARAFYAGLPKPLLIGIEATGYTQWFEGMVAERGHELWTRDPGEIRAREPRRRKREERDAEHLRDLLAGGQFPRIWVPSVEEGDARQLLKDRNKLVPMRTSVRNQLPCLAMSQGLSRKRRLGSAKGGAEPEALSLGLWARQRRQELLELRDDLEPKIEKLNEAVKVEAEKRAGGQKLMTVKGVGAGHGAGLCADGGPGVAVSEPRRAGHEPERALQRRSSKVRPRQDCSRTSG